MNDFYISWAPGRQQKGWGQVLLYAEVCVSGLAFNASCSVANGAKLKGKLLGEGQVLLKLKKNFFGCTGSLLGRVWAL